MFPAMKDMCEQAALETQGPVYTDILSIENNKLPLNLSHSVSLKWHFFITV